MKRHCLEHGWAGNPALCKWNTLFGRIGKPVMRIWFALLWDGGFRVLPTSLFCLQASASIAMQPRGLPTAPALLSASPFSLEAEIQSYRALLTPPPHPTHTHARSAPRWAALGLVLSRLSPLCGCLPGWGWEGGFPTQQAGFAGSHLALCSTCGPDNSWSKPIRQIRRGT